MGAVTDEATRAVPADEVERRYRVIREAMARDGLDAVIACGTEYTGFDGAVIYLSGFAIVHRYAYVLLPLEGDPAIVFPREATYVGEHGTTWIDEQVFVDRPGEWLADRVRGKRVGVFGLDYVMPVRDFTALDCGGRARLVGRRVRPRARREERLRARVGARERPHQRRRLLDVPRGVRARPDRARGARAVRGALRRAAAAAARRWTWCSSARTAPRCRSSRSRARGRSARPTWCCRRSRSPAPAATGSRSRARSAPASRAPSRGR